MVQYSPLQIRLATQGDIPLIASALYDSFKEYEPLYTPGGFKATTPTADVIRPRIDEGPMWVALQDGVIVGTIAAVPKGESLYIRSMAILPSARGHRIGELLLRHVEDFALAQGHRRMFLSTTPFLARAIRLYEKWGFQRTDEGPHDLFGTPLFTMVKTLLTP
ncbi:MAG TPA: GNAT family N-acetyltransferase [Chloroflexia bacterium]|nr:GNAT family N-acetyltransferase [Chloroflexia bacterium]